MHLASGLSVGLAGVAAGYAIGSVGDAVRFRISFFDTTGADGWLRACEHTCNNREFT